MSEDDKQLKQKAMWLSFLRIGVIGFGGGNALVPVMREAFVEKNALVSDESFHDKVFAANITPGALPVEITCGIGKETAGWKGMILAPVLLSLPGAVFTVLLLSCFSALSEKLTIGVEILSVVISLYIIWQLLRYIGRVFRKAREWGCLQSDVLIFLGVTVLVCGKDMLSLFGIENVYVPRASSTLIMICVLILSFLIKRPHRNMHIDLRALTRDEGIWLLVFAVISFPAVAVSADTLQLLVCGGLSALVSFGGGDAYLGIADDLFVQTGMFTVGEFYGTLVTVANILPGSILCKMLTGMGCLLGVRTTGMFPGGVLVAIAAMMCGVFFSCASYMLVENVYRSSESAEVFTFIKNIVKPIVSAFMVSVMLTLITKDMSILQEILIRF